MKVTPYNNLSIDEYKWYKVPAGSWSWPQLIATTTKPEYTINNITKDDACKYFVVYRKTDDKDRNVLHYTI